MDSDSILLIIIVACIIMSAYFSATETAFSSLNRIRVKNMADKGNRKAALVMKLSDNYDILLSTILIGNNIVNITSASLATVLFVKMLGDDIGPGVSTAVTTVIVLIFGEISPKSIAKESPESFALFSAPLLNVFTKVLSPFNFLFGQWKKLLSLVFKTREDSTITEEELLTIVDEARQEGEIDEQESSIIRSAIEFSELEAVDILTPRPDVVALPVDCTKEEMAKTFAETGFSRIPVYEEDIDHIVGIVYQKDFHNRVCNTDREIASIIRPALYITEGKRIGELLKELQKKKSHIAVVLDEFGGTIGIVTMEDILEELVGEIWDEHEQEEIPIRETAEHTYLVDAGMDFDDFADFFHLKTDSEMVSVSGWVMERCGGVPESGDRFTYDDLDVLVVKVDHHRIEELRVTQRPHAGEKVETALIGEMAHE